MDPFLASITFSITSFFLSLHFLVPPFITSHPSHFSTSFYLSLTHCIRTMPPAMASSQLEMTISVFSGRLANTKSSHNIVIGAEAGWSAGAWNVTLKRIGPDGRSLSVDIAWNRPEKQNFINFRSMHVVSRADGITIKNEQIDWVDYNRQYKKQGEKRNRYERNPFLGRLMLLTLFFFCFILSSYSMFSRGVCPYRRQVRL